MSKLLILTGTPKDEPENIEVVDLQNPLNSCNLPEKFPIRLNFAVGGLTKDGPLLCGGYDRDNKTALNTCFTLNNSKIIEIAVKLQTERYSASAIVLPDGELWIHGGLNRKKKLSSSEIISLQGSKNGMVMETTIARHCSTMINSTTAFVTGGNTGFFSYQTYFVDIINWTWTKGPHLEEARADHGCAVFMHNGQNYAIVAGGLIGVKNDDFLSSTEILDLNNEILEWTKGPELPVKMDNFPLLSTSIGIIAVGGYDRTNNRNKNELLNLKCKDGKDVSECKWEESQKKLNMPRSRHVVIPLQASCEICNDTLYEF